MSRQPNIIMILTDDHAAHAISDYGSRVNQTPRIDEIAHRGRRLDNCFVTNSICTPSRAAILTGTYAHINKVYGLRDSIDASQPTFVSLLKEAGYATAIFGKWHMGEGEGHNPESFDQWAVLRGQGEYFNPYFITSEGVIQVEGYATDIITDMALEWLASLDPAQPYCLLINHKAPHRPWEPDDKHRGMYADVELPLPETFWDDYQTRGSAAHRCLMRIADDLRLVDVKQEAPTGLSYEDLALWKYRRYMEDYLACVASVDDNVGRVIDWLDERQQYSNTVLSYTSDQGFFLGDHGWFDKRFMYEESLRMPLVVSCPDQIPALEPGIAKIVTNVDFAQTLLAAAGVQPHPRMQGTSFWEQLIGAAPDETEGEFYYRYWEHDDVDHHASAHYGIRTERYKLIYFYNDGLGMPGTGSHQGVPEWEMYDLAEDPHELKNVFLDPDYAQVRDALIVRLRAAQERVADEPHPSQLVGPYSGVPA